MTSGYSRITLCILPVLVLAFLGSLTVAQAAHPVSPKQLVLRASDLPNGFKRTAARSLSNAQVAAGAHMSLAQVDRLGRITSYQVNYERASASATTGPLVITSEAVSYKTAGGAHQGYGLAIRLDKKPLQHLVRFRQSSPSGIGEEATQYSYQQKSSGYTYSVVILVFRRAEYGGTVIVVGLAGKWKESDALRLARIVDHRMQKAA
jgi:hypothetical protein